MVYKTPEQVVTISLLNTLIRKQPNTVVEIKKLPLSHKTLKTDVILKTEH